MTGERDLGVAAVFEIMNAFFLFIIIMGKLVSYYIQGVTSRMVSMGNSKTIRDRDICSKEPSMTI